MPTTAPESRLHVVVGILRRRDCLLIQQRLPGTPCAGQWEFPGGKVEPGESPRHALARELKEELGIEPLAVSALAALPFDYAHARVWLDVFVVDSFAGEALGREGQQTSWRTLSEIRSFDILAAVPAILDALALEEAGENRTQHTDSAE